MIEYLRERFDLQIAAASLVLTVIGLASIYSATFDAHASDVFFKQLVWAGVGTLVLLTITFVPYRTLQAISMPAYFLSLTLLVGVLLFGRTVSGSTSWFNLGPFRLQPSEFAKITTVLAFASYVSRPAISLRSPRDLLTAATIVAAPALLVVLQPDAGTAVIYLATLFVLLYWGGVTSFTLVTFVAPVAAGVGALLGTTPFLIIIAVFGVLILVTKEHRLVAAVVFSLMVLTGISVQSLYDGLKPYQQKRIATFLDPNVDPLGAGYNILQSKVAIGSGGLAGKGYLRGTQTQLNFIPEQWTDFIFCVPGEEFGFLGAGTVLILFGILIVRGISLGAAVKSRYASLAAIGLTAILAAHICINIAMALGLMPVIGVPLPFMSYGGSSFISSAGIIGILLNLHINRKEY